MFEEDQQRRRIRAGLASPKFTAARQHIEQNFHPPRDIVSNESGMQSLLHSLTAGPPRGGDVPRGEDASQARSAYSSEINDPTAGGEPRGDGREVEIRVVILRDGSVGPSKIKIRSGSPRFNEMALQAVLAAAARVGPPEEGCDVVTRWSVTAAVRMGSLQRLGGVFEETTGAVSGN